MPTQILGHSRPIRDFYGHANLATTNRYLHSKLDAGAVAAMNAAHRLDP
jgi:hypothetical protein